MNETVCYFLIHFKDAFFLFFEKVFWCATKHGGNIHIDTSVQ